MITLTDEQLEIESCVYKLYYGEKYVIVKAKNLAGSLYMLGRGYATFLAGHYKGQGQKKSQCFNMTYFDFYTHVHDNPKQAFRLEILLETNKGFQLLKRESIELGKSIKDKNCLNTNVNAYIPRLKDGYGQSKLYGGYLTKRNIADFERYLKRP